MFKKIAALAFAGLIASVPAAHASTIGPSCGSCLGSSYTLTYSTTGSSNVFDVFLTIDTTGSTVGSTGFLNAVSLKLSSSNPTVSLLSAPSGFTTTVAGGINANGCDGSGSGFFCSPGTGNGVPVGSAGDIYNFEWQVTFGSASDFLKTGDSIKALYVDSTGKQAGITSEDISATLGTPTPTPEPSSLMLLGTGVLGAAGLIRRRLAA